MIKETDQHVSQFNALMSNAVNEVAQIQALVNKLADRIESREKAVAQREAALNAVLEQMKKQYSTELSGLRAQVDAGIKRETILQAKLGGTQRALEEAKQKLQKFGLEEKPEVAKAAAEVGH
jgi:DNA repair ATPase RecN